jgi:hypothetical protein
MRILEAIKHFRLVKTVLIWARALLRIPVGNNLLRLIRTTPSMLREKYRPTTGRLFQMVKQKLDYP